VNPRLGVDISVHNGDVNIKKLKQSVEFVIIRCGYGNDYPNQDDSRFFENVRKCEEANMPYGVYLYSYAQNKDAAISEAKHTLRLLKGLKPLYGVWYDVEDSSLNRADSIPANCVAYCEEIKKAGYYCGIYAPLTFWRNELNDKRLDVYDKWVAHWAKKNGYEKECGIWQYTDCGVIDGKIFDMNLAYKDYPKIIGGIGDEVEMTKEEVRKLIQEEAQKVYDKNEAKYENITDVPNWARADVEKVYKELSLAGTGKKGTEIKIDAGNVYVRVLYIISKLLDKIKKK